MIDPTLMLFDSHLEALVFFGGMFVYVAVLALLGYRDAKTKEEKKDAIAFISVFGPMVALSMGIVGFFGWWI